VLNVGQYILQHCTGDTNPPHLSPSLPVSVEIIPTPDCITYPHAKFGRSALKDVRINTGEPQNWGALELQSLEMGESLT